MEQKHKDMLDDAYMRLEDVRWRLHDGRHVPVIEKIRDRITDLMEEIETLVGDEDAPAR